MTRARRGGGNPTPEMPARTIETGTAEAHDGGMESLLSFTAETLFDPFVVVPALLVVAALVSGLVARIVDAVGG